jgi:hypothetical protein
VRSYGASHQGLGELPKALAAQIQRLGLLKSQAVALGDMRSARHYELQLKRLLTKHKVLYSKAFGKVTLPSRTAEAMAEVHIDRVAALDRHGVPPWFRPGYDNRVRLKLWLRLSRTFRELLQRRHTQGLLPLYLPAPSYWAKLIRPSHFYKATSQAEMNEATEQAGGDQEVAGDPDMTNEQTQAAQAYDKQVAEVADLEQEMAGEAADAEALAATLEAPGTGKLASEEPWYEDRGKLILATVGGIVLLSLVK